MRFGKTHLLAASALGICLTAGFATAASASTYKVLYNFCHGGKFVCTDGKNPAANLVADSAGNFYGTASAGGSDNSGTIFELARTGKNYSYKVLYNFVCSETCTGGGTPVTALIIDTAGNLYGTAVAGGSNFGGTAFELSPNADHSQWTYNVIYNFCSQTGTQCLDGMVPESPLAYAGQAGGAPYDGVSPLYGTTLIGGTSPGSVFQLVPNGGSWTGTTLYRFCAQAGCTDGTTPEGQLAVDNSGNLYGTTAGGGNENGSGVAYKLNIATGVETVLHTFCGDTSCTDGGSVGQAGITQTSKRILFGGAAIGGKNDGGLVYELDAKTGKQKILYDFCRKAGCTDGQGPDSPLVEAGGSLIGTAGGGDANNHGVVYRIGAANKEEVLYTFCQQDKCADGWLPVGVIANGAGHLFGVTQHGGKRDDGVIFELTP